MLNGDTDFSDGKNLDVYQWFLKLGESLFYQLAILLFVFFIKIAGSFMVLIS
jgi:hypothetical protein